MADSIFKRSGFGAFVMGLGVLLIRWAVDGLAPTSGDWIQVLALLLVLLGYQRVRKTVAADDHSEILARLDETEMALMSKMRADEGQK